MSELSRKLRELDLFERKLRISPDGLLYDPLKFSLPDGDIAVIDDLFSFREYNNLMRHFPGAGAIGNPQSGVLQYYTGLAKWKGYTGAVWKNLGDFADGGEAGGAARSLGNTDAEILSLITNNADGIIISAAGEVTKPLNPCFCAYNSVEDADETGDGTSATVDFDTERFDQGDNFTGDTFTAPVDGRYLLTAQVGIRGIGGAHTKGLIVINTSNYNYEGNNIGVNKVPDGNGDYSFKFAVIVDMDAADTAFVQCVVSNGTKIIDIAKDITVFSGCLVS